VVSEWREAFANAALGVVVTSDEGGEEGSEEDGYYGVADGHAGLDIVLINLLQDRKSENSPYRRPPPIVVIVVSIVAVVAIPCILIVAVVQLALLHIRRHL